MNTPKEKIKVILTIILRFFFFNILPLTFIFRLHHFYNSTCTYTHTHKRNVYIYIYNPFWLNMNIENGMRIYVHLLLITLNAQLLIFNSIFQFKSLFYKLSTMFKERENVDEKMKTKIIFKLILIG